MSIDPPIAARRAHRREHHGEVVDDAYEWLRDADDPAVRAYLAAENDYAEAMTAHLEPVRGAIFDEIRSRVQESDLTVPVASGPWWYYTRTVEGQQYALHCRAPIAGAREVPVLTDGSALPGEQILIDGEALAEGHDFFEIGASTVSADHRLLAYSVDVSGDERYDVTVVDLTTGEILDRAVTGIGYGLAFAGGGRELLYTRVDDAWRPHEVWRHQIGASAEADELVFSEPDERFWIGLDTSRDDRWVCLAIGSKTTSEWWLADAIEPGAAFRCVTPRRDGVEYGVEVARDHLLIVHNTHTREGELAIAPLTTERADQWQPLLEPGEGERFLGVEAFDRVAVLVLRHGGLPTLRLLPRLGEGYDTPKAVTVPGDLTAIHLGDTPEPSTDRLRIVTESWTQPRRVSDLVLATDEVILLREQPVRGEVDLGAFRATREWATAPDGTAVPLTIVRHRDVQPDGSAPGILYGYGAYEISMDPYFSVARLSLLQRGVVWAVAHVRGGGELGRGWYDDGKMAAKANTFSDFVACADHLVQSGWVAPDRLAAEGGSAGGLLIGAAVNLAPDRFAAVHAAVPFVDALTTVLRPELPLTVMEWEEWGDPLHDAEVYARMRAYSPYENIAARDYPAILATTSLNDTRVSYTEPAKWIARLRATVTNDPVRRPILLRTELEAGHGGRSGRYDAWRQVAWEWSWLLDRIGAARP
ncbi:S9 family peptidase [Janibacter sp. GXQ6167]|uniref:S9 family peptidase n=1 Tax=Janibacter sp. GXQ6167 TaxID=3240791 RepID=UPI0035231797